MTLRILMVFGNAVIALCQGQYLDLSMCGSVNGNMSGEVCGNVNLTRCGSVNLATGGHIRHIGGSVNLTITDYLVMVKGKTAALFGAACEVGALCAGVDSGRGGLAREFYAQVKCE